MEITELAKAFHHSKLRLTEQESNLHLVHKLISDLAQDEQTFDLQLEIKGLNKEVKIQDTLIEDRKAELGIVEASLLELIKDKAVNEKTVVFIADESYVEFSRNKAQGIAMTGPFKK